MRRAVLALSVRGAVFAAGKGNHMKHVLPVVILAALIMSFAAVASASDGAATPYKATWTDVTGATATCSGSHVVFTTGTRAGTFQESETCLLSGNTSRVVPGTWVGNPSFSNYSNLGGQWIWESDFPGNLGKVADSVTITIVGNGDGTFTETAVTTYH
jgi:hypothetical protein